MNSGLLYAVLAFGLWGVFPLYFREVASVSPLEGGRGSPGFTPKVCRMRDSETLRTPYRSSVPIKGTWAAQVSGRTSGSTSASGRNLMVTIYCDAPAGGYATLFFEPRSLAAG